VIFTALGLLVLAAALLIAGIAKSSVAFLMLSLVATCAAGAALAIAYSIARRSGVIADAPAAGPAGMPQTAMVMYVPVDQLPAMSPAAAAMKVGAVPANGNGTGAHESATPPIAGYESMTAEQVGKLVSSGALSDEQLEALRAYESAHAARKTVLDRIDRSLRA